MNAFEQCKAIEIRALNDIIPFIRNQAWEGRFVITDKGPMAKFLQETVGDLMMNCPKGKIWGVELKSEEEDKYGNFFLETWSNLSFGWNRPGWFDTLKCDVLLYYFLNPGTLYSIPYKPLFEWAHGKVRDGKLVAAPNLHRYTLRTQSKNKQANVTAGHCVNIAELFQKVRFRRYRKTPDGFVEDPMEMDSNPFKTIP